MDTNSIIKKVFGRESERGIALVYVAILIVVLILFVGLAVDIGYIYVVKSQMQNAADSASLAGVAKLPKFPATPDITAFNNLSSARRETWRFAAKNQAIRKGVFLIQSSNYLSPPANLNYGNEEQGDIVLGHWSRTGGFELPNGIQSINAVKVVARRTSSPTVANVRMGDNPVSIFFGRALAALPGVTAMNTMNVSAEAIAAATPGATNYILMCSTFDSTGTGQGLECTPACTYPNICTISPPRVLDKGAGEPYNNAFEWTSLTKQNTPASYLTDMACGRIFPNEDVCGVPVYTTGGETVTFKALESAMYDPNYDAGSKEFSGGQVSAWWIIIPVANSCPPRVQPAPFTVDRFALIRLISVCGSGGGNACKGNNYTAPSCPYGKTNVIAIDRYSCMNCAQRALFIGLKWNLVK